ncbi:MAG: vWA domain-containing protein, partial [Planctomycetota bacterium]
MGALRWQAHLNPVLGAGLILGLVVWLIILYRRLRRQHPAKQAVMLLVPKVLIVLLLILAYYDPVWSVMQRPGKNRKVAVLVDTSSSMEVEDESNSTRVQRAAGLAEELKRGLESSYIDIDALEFDLEVRELTGRNERQGGAEGVRETDLGKCLVTMADKLDSTAPTVDRSSYVGVILITDGGDEVVQDVRLPEVPVYITGVGSEPETWNDIAITTIEAPEVAEEQSDFEVAADIVVRSVSGDFAARAGQVKVRLEEKNADGWHVRAAEVVDLAGVEARAKFRVKAGSAGLEQTDLQQTQSSAAELGTKKYRVRVE